MLAVVDSEKVLKMCSSRFLTLGLAIDYAVRKMNWISKSKIFTFQFDSVRFLNPISLTFMLLRLAVLKNPTTQAHYRLFICFTGYHWGILGL